MKPALAASLLLLALVPAARGAAPATPAPRARTHGVALSGRISRVDRAKMTLLVRDAGGRETALSWTAATKINGGELKPGEAVTLRYLDKDAKHIATYIRINPHAVAAPPPAAAASPTARPL
ncbi:MAG: hypothetical protein ABI592_12305 [Acidobacteriota bacterium]